MNEIQQTFHQLGIALIIGLLIGLERGWTQRLSREGSRVAGVRTYGLIGLFGGVSAVLAEHAGALILSLSVVALAITLATAYAANWKSDADIGITSIVAALLTFVLGALAASGEIAIAGASAVVITLLLTYKPILHRWVATLEREELRAGIKLLLISVVLLPILPDQGYGPWGALNPYEIWWMVVLVATISCTGYFAMKIGGTRNGAVLTGLFGGLASSTAVTLHFSRLSKRESTIAASMAIGILVACGTMFPRLLLLVSLINLNLLKPLLLPAVVMASLTYLPVLVYWRSQSRPESDTSAALKNPLELTTALGFGLILLAVMFFGALLKNWYGDIGLIVLAAVSGVTDVDAITLFLTRLSQEDLTTRLAVTGIVCAAAVNSLVKAGIATVIGGSAVGIRVGLPLFVSALGGLLVVWHLFW